MPSDPRVAQALAAFAEPIGAFRSILANTSEQIRLLISKHIEHNGASVEGVRAEFGAFASGRIDSERMSRLLRQVEPRDLENGEIVVRAFDTCNELLARGDRLFQVAVAEGGDLRSAVSDALARIGRAYGAARVADLVSLGSYRESENGGLLDAHPFEHWNRSERKVPLCLVVSVAGRDLRVGGLADFVDRAFKLVLVVHGDAPPAALVRLVTPGVLVLQTADPADLERVARFDGPAVAALVPDSAAHFRHDPAAGSTLAERLVVDRMPESAPRRLGVSSGFQQREDLAQLEALAALAPAPQPPVVSTAPPAPGPQPSPTGTPSPASPADDDVEKLSAWLLRQADLPGSR
jgi:hypothetical protein